MICRVAPGPFGHNAIVRVRAFAEAVAARMSRKTRPSGPYPQSHDYS